MRDRYRLFLLLLTILCLCISVGAAETINVNIACSPGTTINANENMYINVDVSNQTGKMVGNKVQFSVASPSLGVVTPYEAFTDLNGRATSTLTASSTGGTGVLTITVYYMDEGIEKTKVEQRSIQVIPFPDLILIEPRDPVSDSYKKWLVANGKDQAKISVWAINSTTNYPIPNLKVELNLVNKTMGILSPVTLTTDGYGRANSLFTTKTRSGVAQVYAKVYYNETLYTTNSTLIFIDHDIPYKIDGPTYPDFKSEVEVGTNTTISVRMVDTWGNIIDNRRELDEGRVAEQVKFIIEGSPSGLGSPVSTRFRDGETFVQDITRQVNESGIIAVEMAMDQKPGDTYIRIIPPATIPEHPYVKITGEATGIPYGINVTVNPAGIGEENPWVYAGTDTDDPSLKFTLTYEVLDQYGNGLQLKDIDIVILAGAEREDITLTTNSTGYASFKYGPRSLAIRDLVVTATPRENQTVSVTTLLDFISTNPEDIVITANPQSMASRDANPAAKAEIKAKVINAVGDGVAGEIVNFTIQNINYPETYTVTLEPAFKDGISSNITDENGYATVTFLPGAFTQVFGDEHYDSTATGNCELHATWQKPGGGTVDKCVELTWKNYPYLNVVTYLDKETANVSDTVSVTIKLIGDGYKMEAKPIDVMICHDRSGSMLMDLPDRMVSAMDAAKAFVSSTSSGKDRTGLVSFGYSGTVNIGSYSTTSDYLAFGPGKDRYWGWSWTYWRYMWLPDTSDDASYIASHYPGNRRTYSGYATVDTHPSLDWDKVNVTNAINRLAPWGGTPMRYGLYKSIKEFESFNRADAVKAIILITDGDYNYYGDPLARGTGYTLTDKSETTYSEETLDYTIFSDISYQNLSRQSFENGIKIFTIAYSSDISSHTNNTLKILAEGTGGKHYVAPTGSDLLTIYSLIAGQLREEAGVDTTVYADFGTIEVNGEEMAGNQVLSYVANYPVSTNTSRYYSKNLTTQFGYIDHSEDWNATMRLPFTVGTMNLQDVWSATMSFRIDRPGNIQLFNHSQPAIFFNTPEGQQVLTLPDTYLFASVLQSPSPGYGEFTETEFEVENPIGTIYEWTWNREYTGDKTIREQYFISINGGKTWIQVGQRDLSPEQAKTEKTGYFKFDVKNLLPPGTQQYTVDFRLTGRAIDAPSPRRVGGGASVNPSGIYILLE